LLAKKPNPRIGCISNNGKSTVEIPNKIEDIKVSKVLFE
jgi:hypothetical protein